MEENLKQELIHLAQKILNTANSLNSTYLIQQDARALYEKAVILNYLNSNKITKNIPQSVNNQPFAPHNIIGGVNPSFQNNNPLQSPSQNLVKEVITPAPQNNAKKISFDIKKENTLEDILSNVPQPPVFQEKTPKENTQNIKTINDISSKEIQLGLNDRLAFISHLFLGNDKAFSQVISALNECKTSHEALTIIETEIKPAFNHWKNKEEYEERFLNAIMRKFS